MKKTLNVGIIGAGFAADFHAEALKRVTGTDVRLVGIVGGNRQRAEDFARRHGIPHVFGSIAELLTQPQIDVVCVCVPIAAHADAVIAAANAGKHSGTHSPLSRRRDTAGGGALMTLGAHPIAAAIHLKTYEASLAGVRIGGVRNTFEVYATNTVRADMTSDTSLTAFTPDPAAFVSASSNRRVPLGLSLQATS